jgi:anti-anti-sigma factor
MLSVDLTIRNCGDRVVAGLRGELDVVDAEAVATVLAATADRGHVVIADLAGLMFIDGSGLAALVRARRHARDMGAVISSWPRRSGRYGWSLPWPGRPMPSRSMLTWPKRSPAWTIASRSPR